MKNLIIATALFAGVALAVFLLDPTGQRASRVDAGPEASPTVTAPTPTDLDPAEVTTSTSPESTPPTERSVVETTDASVRPGDWTFADGKVVRVRLTNAARLPSGEVVELLAFESERSPRNLLLEDGAFQKARKRVPVSKLIARSTFDTEGLATFELPDQLDEAHVAAMGRFAYTTQTVVARPADEPATLEVSIGGILRVTLVGTDGSTPQNVTDTEATIDGDPTVFDMSDSRSLDAYAAELSPDEEGVLEFEAVPAGRAFELVVRHPDLAVKREGALEAIAGELVERELTLEAACTLFGDVQRPDGTPIAGATIRCSGEGVWGNAGTTMIEVESEEDGSYRITTAPSGAIVVTASKDGLLDTGAKTLEMEPAGEQRQDFTLDPGNSIRGRVTHADGTPLSDIDVVATFDPDALMGAGAWNAARGARSKTKSGEEGAFEVTGLGNGPFIVFATHEEESEGVEQEFISMVFGIAPGTEGVELVLEPMPVVSGRVLDSAGEPVTNFTISGKLVLASPWIPGPTERKSFESEDGSFKIAKFHEGKWSVTAKAEGYATSAAVDVLVPLAPDAEPLTLRLSKAASVAGIIVDPNGNPVNGAEVSVPLTGADLVARRQGSLSVPTSISSEDGTFELTGLGVGETSIFATHPNFADSLPIAVELAESQRLEGEELVLRVGATLTGEVFDKEGEPHGGGSVYLQDMTTFDGRMVSLDGEGRFEETGLNPGSVTVTVMYGVANPGNGEDGEGNVAAMMENMRFANAELTDGETTHVVLGAPPADPVRVTVRFTHAGDPPPPGSVVTFLPGDVAGWEALKMSTVDEDGRATVTLDEPGEYLMQFQANSTELSSFSQNNLEFREDIPKAEEHSITVELPVASIGGRVKGPDGTPEKGVRVVLSPAGGVLQGSMNGGQYAMTSTDAEGYYTFDYLRSGTYRVTAGGSMMFLESTNVLATSTLEDVQVETGERVSGVDFRLQAACKLSGKVVDETGAPVARASIFVEDSAGSWVDALSMISTGADGRFEIDGIPEGRATVFARAKGLASLGVQTTVTRDSDNELELLVQTGTELILRPIGKDNQPVKATVRVVGPDDREFHGLMALEEIMSGTRGWSSTEQIVGPLPPGKYVVFAELPDGRKVKKTVTLKGQAQRKLKLRLR